MATKHVTFNKVAVHNRVGCYGIKEDALGRASYYKIKLVTVGAHKGQRVWSRMSKHLIPQYAIDLL